MRVILPTPARPSGRIARVVAGPVAGLAALAVLTSPALGQRGGRDVFEAVCAQCHGTDGRGEPGAQMFPDVAMPDFTDCSFNSREPDSDFLAVASEGGPARGFSPVMPPHGQAYDREVLQKTLDCVRTLCADDDWPRGELNLPRPFVTEKAFPEDEAVLTTHVDVEGTGAVTNELLYEKRFGARNQFEIKVPLMFMEDPTDAGGWDSGIGDVAIGFKRAFAHSFERGYILSLGGEVKLPVGDDDRGFGKGTTVLEPFLSFGQLLPADAFMHMQLLAEFPTDGDLADPEGKWRGVLGRTFRSGTFGRAWTPMVEVLGTAEFADDETEYMWDVAPQLQVTLNQRQHVMLAVGALVPVTDAEVRDTRLMVYLLWDWFDGGFFEGW